MEFSDEIKNKIEEMENDLINMPLIKSNKKRCFLVSRHFLPSTASRSLTMFKLLKNSSFEYIVSSQYVQNNKWLYGVKSNMTSRNIHQIITTEENEWEELVVREFFNLDPIYKFDFIMTCIMPPYDHKIGLEIKKRRNTIPWVALWSDPVAFSPYANKAGDFENVAEIKKKEYEKEIFRKADLLVFTNYHQMIYMLGDDFKKYREKSVIVHHGFDPDYYPKENYPSEEDRIVLAYIGHMDEYRNLYELANGLKLSKYGSMFKVILIGHVPEEQLDYVKKLGLEDIFEYLGEKSWEECLIEMKKCDILVSMDPNYVNMDYSQQMSSKIADYLGAKKPILFMSYDKGISADIANYTNNKLIRNRGEDVAKFLDSVATLGIWMPDYEKYEIFNSRNISAYFDKQIFLKLLKI